MKLYWGPHTCAIGTHVLLEEIGKPYELAKLDIRGGENHRPPFSELNPKGKVPTLQRDDGAAVTEFPVIAHYLAKTNPDTGLLPKSAEAELRAAEAMDCVATIHMQGFARQFRPSYFSPDEAGHDKVKAQGREMAAKGFGIMDKALVGKEWIAGEYSIADSALFYVAFWGSRRAGMDLPPNVAAHLDRMLARPAVQRMIEQEGLKA